VEWITPDEVLGAVGVTPPGSPDQASRAALVAGLINTGIDRTLDRPPVVDNEPPPVVIPGEAEIRHAAVVAAMYAYRRFDTAFDSVNYGDMNQASLAPKVARDALAYVMPQLDRWRWVAVG
jgi:hypothetical protein